MRGRHTQAERKHDSAVKTKVLCKTRTSNDADDDDDDDVGYDDDDHYMSE